MAALDLRTEKTNTSTIKGVHSYDLRKGEQFLTYCYDAYLSEGSPNDYRIYISRMPDWGGKTSSSKLPTKRSTLYQTYLARGAGPVWSPQGDRIAFMRDGHIFVIKVPEKYLQ